MELRIDTDGYAPTTALRINGRVVTRVKEFHFSVATRHRDRRGRMKGGACKMQIVREVEPGKPELLEYYGEGFRKFDEENFWEGVEGYVGDEQGEVGRGVQGGS